MSTRKQIVQAIIHHNGKMGDSANEVEFNSRKTCNITCELDVTCYLISNNLMDCPKEFVYEPRMLFQGMRFPNKVDVKYVVNIYCIKNNGFYKVIKSGTNL